MRRCIIITGQTATGKTKLALTLAKKYHGEIINADSRQIYKQLDIVTGKDVDPKSKIKSLNPEYSILDTEYDTGYYLLDEIKLWGLDLITPDKPFSSSQYVEYVNYLLENIIAKDKTVIIAGGTYLYIKHLLYGIDTERIKPDWRLRNRLNQLSVLQLQILLSNKNKKAFNAMNHSDQNNPRRLIRKLEIISAGSASKQPRGLHSTGTYGKLLVKIIGLKFKSNMIMSQKILDRVNQRIKQGAIDEAKKMLKIGYKLSDPGLNSIGYPQILKYLDGKITIEQMINLWTTAEIQYAKRQYTFMKKSENIKWIEV